MASQTLQIVLNHAQTLASNDSYRFETHKKVFLQTHLPQKLRPSHWQWLRSLPVKGPPRQPKPQKKGGLQVTFGSLRVPFGLPCRSQRQRAPPNLGLREPPLRRLNHHLALEPQKKHRGGSVSKPGVATFFGRGVGSVLVLLFVPLAFGVSSIFCSRLWASIVISRACSCPWWFSRAWIRYGFLFTPRLDTTTVTSSAPSGIKMIRIVARDVGPQQQVRALKVQPHFDPLGEVGSSP